MRVCWWISRASNAVHRLTRGIGDTVFLSANGEPWFRLDDSFHSHPKVIAAGNEAVGLYVRCGTYAAQHLTDGFIPEQVALQYGTPALVAKLVETRLWRRARGGWRMPDYLEYNPSAEQVRRERKAAAQRQRRHRSVTSPRHNGDMPFDQPFTLENPVENGTGKHAKRETSRPP